MILVILITILILFITCNNEHFELLGNDDDIFQIKKETINTTVPCYINGNINSTNIGYETTLTTNEDKNIKTCDFGDAQDRSCDHIEFTCKTETCNEIIKPVLNINGDYRCRKLPYII